MSHSKYFSPSGAKRWIPCPASAILNADKESVGNAHSDRGTALHTFCEQNFDKAPEEIDFKSLGEDEYDVRSALQMAWGLESAVGDPDMTKLELQVPILTGDDPPDTGTADLVMFDRLSGHLLIGDYKFGYGAVNPEMNEQLMVYALGAMELLDHKVDKVTLAIIQPKQSKQALMWDTTAEDLLTWKKNVMDEAVGTIQYLINSQKAPSLEMYHPSDAACQWCLSKTDCPAKQNEIENILNYSLPNGEEIEFLTEKAELAEKLRGWISTVSAQLGALEAEIINALESGTDIPGFKLVRGRPGNRKWKDAEQADKWLAARKLKMQERYTMKVINPTQAAKLLDVSALSTKLQNAFENMIERPEGKLTWVRDDSVKPKVEVASVSDLMTDEFADL